MRQVWQPSAQVGLAIGLNRKSALFAGHGTGAANWVTIASLIEASKRIALDSLAYLSAMLTAIVNGHKRRPIEELLHWSYRARVFSPGI